MKQIRNLAISGVDTLVKANKVCEIVGDADALDNGYRDGCWFYDYGDEKNYMVWGRSDVDNFIKCTQMTYEEFLEKYDSEEIKQVVDNPDVNSFTDKHFANIANNKLAEMKELYESEPDKWIWCFRYSNEDDWRKVGENGSTTVEGIQYKLILKEYEYLADAVIANPDVEVEYKHYYEDEVEYDWKKVVDFFGGYCKGAEYQLAKPQYDGKFNGGYIKASQEAYDKLVELGYNKTTVSWFDGEYFELVENQITSTTFLGDCTGKQFYLVSEEFTETKPTSANNAQVEPTISKMEKVETISTRDDNGKEYKFEKPEFEVILLRVIDDEIFGAEKVDGESRFEATSWNKITGESRYDNNYLTPIKPKQWILMKQNNSGFAPDIKFKVAWTQEMKNALLETGWKLTSRQDIEDAMYFSDGAIKDS